MIGYVTVGTNDLERSKQFYDNLFGELGARSFFANERIVFWTVKDGASSFAVAKPYDEKEASVGNGNMVAINVSLAITLMLCIWLTIFQSIKLFSSSGAVIL